jgi:hypothetical protein
LVAHDEDMFTNFGIIMQTHVISQKPVNSQVIAVPRDVQQQGRDIQCHLLALLGIYKANGRPEDKLALESKFKEFKGYLSTRRKLIRVPANDSGMAFLESVLSRVEIALEQEKVE